MLNHLYNKTHQKIFMLVIFSAFLLVTAWFVIKVKPQNQTNNYQVATTIFPLFDITRQIAGEQIKVIQLIPSGSSPHTYEPTIVQIQQLQQADLLFAIGLGIDEWAIEDGANQKIINLHHHVNLIENDDDHHKEAENESDHHHVHDFDPHYWLSPKNGKIMAQIITEELSKKYPDKKQKFEKNLEIFNQSIDQQIAELEKKMHSNPSAGIITFHNAYNYLARDFSITILTTVEPFPGKEPTAKYLSQLVDTIESQGVKYIFKEPQLSDKVLKSLADDYQIQIYNLDPLGGSGDINSYQKLIEYNINQIVLASQ